MHRAASIRREYWTWVGVWDYKKGKEVGGVYCDVDGKFMRLFGKQRDSVFFEFGAIWLWRNAERRRKRDEFWPDGYVRTIVI